jgi:deazaflavin-dependent oxidoreductase (nitroreductase family)
VTDAPVAHSVKHRIVHALQQRLVNPPMRALFAVGAAPPGWVLLETTGRRSGKPRRTPVGDGRVGSTLWIVAEHGRRAGYVRNIEANPQVRVRIRRGLGFQWVRGLAFVLPEDDPIARQRTLARGHPLRALNALAVRAMGTDLVTVRVDLGQRR